MLKHTRPEIYQFIKTVQKKHVATVDHLYMVDHVKLLMYLRLYSTLQHNHWGPDRQMVLLRNYWALGLGPGAPRIDLPGASVALLVTRRTNNQKIVGSRPTKVACITVLTGNRME